MKKQYFVIVNHKITEHYVTIFSATLLQFNTVISQFKDLNAFPKFQFT